jgi:hypothetical protein
MHRTDATDNVANLFADPDPGTGRLGTKVDAAIMNAFQEELCNLIEAMGVTLVKGTNTQLRDACVSAATGLKIVRRDASGRAQVADPSAAADVDTLGARDAALAAGFGGSAGTLTASTGWSLASGVYIYKVGSLVVFSVDASCVSTSGTALYDIVTLPVGFRPPAPAGVYGMGHMKVIALSAAQHAADWQASGAVLGVRGVYCGTNGARVMEGVAPLGTPQVGDRVYMSGAFYV